MDDTPTLMQVLKNEYELAKRNNGPEKTAAEAHGDYHAFLVFCDRFLSEHRMVEHWPADFNIGIRLSNNQRVLLSPPTGVQDGSMQSDGAVSVTAGQSQPGQDGVIKDDSTQRVT